MLTEINFKKYALKGDVTPYYYYYVTPYYYENVLTHPFLIR